MKMPDKIIILEFKLSKYGSAKDALVQIKDKGYVQKYINDKLPIHIIGISFDAQNRNLHDYAVEQIK